MKKKQIEKVAYLPVGHMKQKQYLATAQTLTIGDEETLIVDIYHNSRKKNKLPIVRIALCEKSFGNYWPREKRWSNVKIENLGVLGSLSRENTGISEEHIRLIKDYTHDLLSSWIQCISERQKAIRQKDYFRREDLRYKRLKERLNNVEAPNDMFFEWVREDVFEHTGHIFYRRHGRFADFSCGCCGQEYTAAVKAKDSFEGMFERIHDMPERGKLGRCEKCGTEGVYTTTKKPVVTKKQAYMIEPYLDKGAAVMRYFCFAKTEAPGCEPEYNGTEISRIFFEPKNHSVQRDYHILDHYTGETYWIPNNIPGMSNISLKPGKLWPESEVKGTCLEYAQAGEFNEMAEYYRSQARLSDYLITYWNWPQLEMVLKLGMWQLAELLVKNYWNATEYVDRQGKTPADFLRIKKERIPLLRGHYSREMHAVLTAEKESNTYIAEEDIRTLAELGISKRNLITVLSIMSARKFVNRTLGYCDITRDDIRGCSASAFGGVTGAMSLYCDYLTMKQAAGYDMTNEIFAHPRDLMEAHGQIVAETRQIERDKRAKEVRERFPGIAKSYKMLARLYNYKKDGYCIRPAKDAEEIVAEGRTLHHCVGGDNYLRSHEKLQSTILFLRFDADPDTPYVTVEVRGYRVAQWFGAYDKKPEKDKLDKWLKDWIAWAENKAIEQNAIAYAG